MSETDDPRDVTRLLTVLIGVLLLFALAMFVIGEYLVAGVTFLSLTFAIYLRETW